MNPAVRPIPAFRDCFDDDEPTRVMQYPPPSLGGLAVSIRPPAFDQGSYQEYAPSAASGAQPRRSRTLPLTLAAGLVLGLCALVFTQFVSSTHLVKESRAQAVSLPSQVVAAAMVAPEPPAAEPAPAAAEPAPAAAEPAPAVEDRADAGLDRASLNPINGGLVTFPSTFASMDGAYDLVIHFHGHQQIVSESFEHAGLNAVVATINLGLGSAAYNNHFSYRPSLGAILDKVQAAVEKRGLRGARLRRIALSAFSAGYGAVRGVLSHPTLVARVDAVLLLDGIHTGYLPRDGSLDIERLMPFERFAEQAVSGKKLFSITHSEISPNGEYASTHECTDAVLALLGIERGPGGEAPAIPALPSLENVARLIPLAPLSEAHRGEFHVRGYAGTQKPDHIMHLAQMSETVVPDLVRFWSESPAS